MEPKSSVNEEPKKDESEQPKKKVIPKRLKRITKEIENKNQKNFGKVDINKQLEEGFLINVQGMIELGNFLMGIALIVNMT